MIYFLLSWLAAALFIEALVEILVESDIFFGLRNFILKVNPGFFGKLVICGYCMSMWCAATIAWALPGNLTNIVILDIIIRILCLHRLSNILHELFVRWFKRLPFVVVFNKVDETDLIVEVPDEST